MTTSSVSDMVNPYPKDSTPYLQFELKRATYFKYLEASEKVLSWMLSRANTPTTLAKNDPDPKKGKSPS